MLTLPSDNPHADELGSVSPIKIELDSNGNHNLVFETKQHNIWKPGFTVIKAPPYATELVGIPHQQAYLYEIVMPCASPFQVAMLDNACDMGCLICSVQYGEGEPSLAYQIQVEDALWKIMEYDQKKGLPFQSTLSGGSMRTPDGGFFSIHAKALNDINRFTQEYGFNKSIQTQLEMILPQDKNQWGRIFQTMNDHLAKGNRILSTSINLENVFDSERRGLLGDYKGSASVDDHIEFAHHLNAATKGKVTMNSLVLYGWPTPDGISEGNHMAEELAIHKRLVANGMSTELSPLRVVSWRRTKALQHPLNFVNYMLQHIGVECINQMSHRRRGPGCDGSCSGCNNLAEIKSLLNYSRNDNCKSLQRMLLPLTSNLGPLYNDTFMDILQNYGNTRKYSLSEP
jgi:hypothetical protein